MKKVLFISVTNLNLKEKETVFHLKRKFEGLSKRMKIYILTKGVPFHINIWRTDFYLLKPGIFFWPLAFFIAFYLCLTKKIDTIIVQSPLIEGFVGSILKIFFKKELIVEIHGDWIEGPFLSKKRRLEFLERKFVPILAKVSFKQADKIRGVADCLIEKAKKIAPDKQYFLFPTFTDLDSFLKEQNTRLDAFIVFVGQLEKVKGINILIEAFTNIKRDFPDFKLVIIGEGSERKNLEFKIKDLGLKNKVKLKGKLSLEQTKDIMKRCYCLVLPSLSEGLPRVLMEAMALEKPVIASNVGGIPELIKDNENGFLFEKGHSKELARKLKILLEDRNLAKEMGKKGKEFVESKFSNEKYIKNYISMINA